MKIDEIGTLILGIFASLIIGIAVGLAVFSGLIFIVLLYLWAAIYLTWQWLFDRN
jgi:hypothetical protein